MAFAGFNSVAFNEYNPYAGGDNNAQFSYMDYSTAEAEPADEWDTSFEEEATIQTSKPMVNFINCQYFPGLNPTVKSIVTTNSRFKINYLVVY